MSELIGGLNAASGAWWTWAVHAGWQAAAVGLAILVVERLGGRWPSPIRHWLLVLALVKFAVPATVGLPIGLFGWVGPEVHARKAPADQDSLAAFPDTPGERSGWPTVCCSSGLNPPASGWGCAACRGS
jgi:hypothetical protein